MRAQGATIYEDSIKYRVIHTQHYKKISLENVSRIKQRTGSYAGKGFAWGLGFGAGYSLAEAIFIEVSQNYEFRKNATARYVLFTGICAAGGALIPIHQTIYLGNLPSVDAVQLKIEPILDFSTTGLSFKFQF
ncbi:MAG: hypothetical protein EA362_04490 [Saprospirales bacterium]|nr:MAG: hypothetical protein EA362_04490 [Saprospirales bacterium]